MPIAIGRAIGKAIGRLRRPCIMMGVYACQIRGGKIRLTKVKIVGKMGGYWLYSLVSWKWKDNAG
jgi:hypothetical protein